MSFIVMETAVHAENLDTVEITADQLTGMSGDGWHRKVWNILIFHDDLIGDLLSQVA